MGSLQGCYIFQRARGWFVEHQWTNQPISGPVTEKAHQPRGLVDGKWILFSSKYFSDGPMRQNNPVAMWRLLGQCLDGHCLWTGAVINIPSKRQPPSCEWSRDNQRIVRGLSADCQGTTHGCGDSFGGKINYLGAEIGYTNEYADSPGDYSQLVLGLIDKASRLVSFSCSVVVRCHST